MVCLTSEISVVLLLVLSAIIIHKGICSTNMKLSCNGKDRSALLIFKHGVVDGSNNLSSWSNEEDCCAWKGVQCDNMTGRVTRLDLNQQYLEGEINQALLQIEFLTYLDLSLNGFTGLSLPKIHNTGGMKSLEVLDLSYNHLSGEIPAAISSLSFLTYLNLSYNDFTGQIPLGTQLQSFDAWSYVGNPKLCGPPLTKNCSKEENHDKAKKGGANQSKNESLYLGMGVGFAVGLCGVWGSLFLNRAWRHRYFHFVGHILDCLYVFVQVKMVWCIKSKF